MIYEYLPATTYHDLYARFGDPMSPTFEQDNIVSVAHQIGGGKAINIRSHKAIVQPLHDVFVALQQYGVTSDLFEYDGCYVVRDIRGSSYPSLHSWGLAVDFDASKFPLGSDDRLPHLVLLAFKQVGFFYGGDFHHRLDPMHFEWSTGLI